MKYINQLKYEHLPYPTDMDHPGSPMQKASVKKAGCGLCSICMVIDRLLTTQLTLQKCVKIAVECGANRRPGTNMSILAPVIAERYRLDYKKSNNIQDVLACVREGGCVIANVGGDRDDGKYEGVFSHGGHYITVISEAKGKLCILDPSWRSDKYEKAIEDGRIITDQYFVYCEPELLEKETDNRDPGYHLFKRRQPF